MWFFSRCKVKAKISILQLDCLSSPKVLNYSNILIGIDKINTTFYY